MNTYVAHINVQHLRENWKCASTKRGTILERNASRMKSENLYRENGIRLLLFDKHNLISQ